MSQTVLFLFKRALSSIAIAVATVFALGSISSTALAQDQYPKLPFMGPNCWNITLMHHGVVQHYRTVNMNELWLYMHSPFCRKITKSEANKRGDIGILFAEDFSDNHSILILDEKTVLWKGSPYSEDQIETKSLEEAKEFPLPALFFRCDFSELRKNRALYVLKFEERLSPIESVIENFVLAKTPIEVNKVKENLAKLLTMRDELLNTPEFIAGRDRFHSIALLTQIEGQIMQSSLLITVDQVGAEDLAWLQRAKTVIDSIEERNGTVKQQMKEFFNTP